MEDVFGVSDGHNHSSLPAGTVSGGLDGKGHLGYAAQPGLAPFGPDVFNNAGGGGHGGPGHGGAVPWLPASTGIGFAAIAAAGVLVWYRRDRRTSLPRRATATGEDVAGEPCLPWSSRSWRRARSASGSQRH
jgi:hypothetical protein